MMFPAQFQQGNSFGLQAGVSQQASQGDRESPTFGRRVVKVLKKVAPILIGVIAAVAFSSVCLIASAVCVVIGVSGTLYLTFRRSSEDRRSSEVRRSAEDIKPSAGSGVSSAVQPRDGSQLRQGKLSSSSNTAPVHYKKPCNGSFIVTAQNSDVECTQTSQQPSKHGGKTDENHVLHVKNEQLPFITTKEDSFRSMSVNTQMPTVSRDVVSGFKVALKEFGIDEAANIYLASGLDDVFLRKLEQKPVLLGSAVAAQYGLGSVGSVVVHNSFSNGFLFQTISSGSNGVLVLVSNIEDIVQGQVDLKIPVDHNCNSSFMTKINSGGEAVVYDKGNGQVLCAVDCHALVRSSPVLDVRVLSDEASRFMEIPRVARERLCKMLKLAQFENYVHLSGFSFSPDGCTLYITMEKLEEVNFRLFAEESYAPLLRDFFLSLKAMKKQGAIHGDVSPKNIMVRNKDGKAQLVLIDVGYQQDCFGTRGYSEGRTGAGQDIQSAAISLCDLINQERYKSSFENALGSFRSCLYRMYREGVKGAGFSQRNLQGIAKFVFEDFGSHNEDEKVAFKKEITRFLSCESNIFNLGVLNKYEIYHLPGLGAMAYIMMAMPKIMAELDAMSGNKLVSENSKYFGGWYGCAMGDWQKTASTSSENRLCLKALIAFEKCKEQYSQNPQNWNTMYKAGSRITELFVQLIGVQLGTVSVEDFIHFLEQGDTHLIRINRLLNMT